MRCLQALAVLGIILMLSSCGSPYALGVSPRQWSDASPAVKSCWLKAYSNYKKEHPVMPGESSEKDRILLSIRGGTAAFPPHFDQQSYYPISDTLARGSCHAIKLRSKTGDQKTKLYVCYDKKTIALDPSHYDRSTTNGSLILTYQPLWSQGFGYRNMDTDGYVRFKRATITVTSLG